jgi:chromate transport protein ChrA
VNAVPPAPEPAKPDLRVGKTLVLVLVVALIVVFGLVVPGLGLVLGGSLALTVYRNQKSVRHWLFGLSAAVTALAIAGLIISHSSGGTKFRLGPPIRVDRHVVP